MQFRDIKPGYMLYAFDRAAYKVANDPDGYEGMIFCRWTADAIGKAISINWKKFI